MPFKWGGANEQTLRDNFGRISAKEVAKLIPGATRNMVIGKAKRLGLVTDRPAHVYPRTAGMTAAVTRQARVPNPVRGLRKVGNWGKVPVLVEDVPLDIPDFLCKPVTLADLKDHHCRWPLDGGLYCGLRRLTEHQHGAVGGSPYCAVHHRRGHKPAAEHLRLGRRR